MLFKRKTASLAADSGEVLQEAPAAPVAPAPAPEPELAEAEDTRPKRRGWWSLG